MPGEVTSKSGSRKPYLYMTPGQQFQIGKRAAEHGITTSMRYFARKYPDLPLKETSVRRLKNLYLDKVPELDGTQQVSNSSDDESWFMRIPSAAAITTSVFTAELAFLICLIYS